MSVRAVSLTPLILDLCGGTGSWSRPYSQAGYDVQTIDPLADGRDVRELELERYKNASVRGILAAPPCTHFSASGARWWKDKGKEPLLEGLSVVDACLRAVLILQPEWWALENPVGRLRRYIGPPAMSFDPCDFGDPYTKRTLLWGRFNPPERNPVEPTEGSKMHKLSPGPDRWRLRSETPPGFAAAFFRANP